MIAMGVYLLATTRNPAQNVGNLWSHGGFLPNGMAGLVMAFPFVMFAFGGVETLSFAAAETENPRKVIPKAINQIIVRVLMFYVGAMVVLLSLTPWNDLVAQLKAGGGTYSSSPFVLVFSGLGESLAADLLNFVIFTAALSVYNSMVYSTSRMLYGMAQEGNAPRSLLQVNRRGVPVRAIAYPAFFTALCVVLNYVAPAGVLELLMSLLVAALVLTWTTIIVVHLKYRRVHDAKGVPRSFPAPFFPLGNYLCLLALAVLLVVMLMTPGIRSSVVAIPVWIAIVYVFYRCIPRAEARPETQASS